jgi:hypothetical protein
MAIKLRRQLKAVVIDETGQTLAGNGLVEVASALGLDRVRAAIDAGA